MRRGTPWRRRPSPADRQWGSNQRPSLPPRPRLLRSCWTPTWSCWNKPLPSSPPGQRKRTRMAFAWNVSSDSPTVDRVHIPYARIATVVFLAHALGPVKKPSARSASSKPQGERLQLPVLWCSRPKRRTYRRPRPLAPCRDSRRVRTLRRRKPRFPPPPLGEDGGIARCPTTGCLGGRWSGSKSGSLWRSRRIGGGRYGSVRVVAARVELKASHRITGRALTAAPLNPLLYTRPSWSYVHYRPPTRSRSTKSVPANGGDDDSGDLRWRPSALKARGRG